MAVVVKKKSTKRLSASGKKRGAEAWKVRAHPESWLWNIGKRYKVKHQTLYKGLGWSTSRFYQHLGYKSRFPLAELPKLAGILGIDIISLSEEWVKWYVTPRSFK